MFKGIMVMSVETNKVGKKVCASLKTHIIHNRKDKKNGGGGGNRTRVRKSSALGSTCIVLSLNLTASYPRGRTIKRRFW
ncbi:hypothetical protein BGP_4273 [Beggiatoa sp. PS]|nr:hypothetical protein BGP_4273 [Beggiatoa sp. PS]